jgi:acylphosphatase
MSDQKMQMHAIFEGRIQGVGFRYTVEKMANILILIGYVKNLSNGTVEVVAAGPKKQLDLLLHQIHSYFDVQDQSISFSEKITLKQKKFIIEY